MEAVTESRGGAPAHTRLRLRGGAPPKPARPLGRAAKKVVEEKTFGMKNKGKSVAVKKFVQSLEQLQ